MLEINHRIVVVNEIRYHEAICGKRADRAEHRVAQEPRTARIVGSCLPQVENEVGYACLLKDVLGASRERRFAAYGFRP